MTPEPQMEPADFLSDPIAAYQRAASLHSSGQLAEAAGLYCQLLGKFPGHPLVMTGLGTITLQQGSIEEGVRLLQRSLEIEPNQPMALANLGLALRSLGQPIAAITCFDTAIALDPRFEDAHNYRGLALHDLHRLGEALDSFDRAIALNPGSEQAYNNRGAVLLEMDRPEEALECFEKAINANAGSADAYSNRGNALRLLGRLNESLASCKLAVSLHPDHALAYNNMGSALHALDRLDEAMACYERAISLKPDYAEAYYNFGTLLHECGQLDQAVANLCQAIARKPDYAEAYWNLALLKLVMGNFDEGWQLYEWRWKTVNKGPTRSFAEPLWLGDESLNGKVLLIHAEQGFGDFIQFCRYALLAEARGAKVILEVPAALVSLLSTLKETVSVVEQGLPLPPFDLHCPVMSLPLAFKTTVDSIPATVPYLHADTGKQNFWRQRLCARTAPRVGLAWSGSPTHKNDRNRSIPLALLKPLLQLPLEFHALQKDFRPHDIAVLNDCGQLHFHHGELKEFSDTAALLQEMDLVICVDTSVAHLAGAMGKPVWVMLPFVPDFRWMLHRKDSPWYPTMTLFRQTERGNWPSIISDVRTKLENQWSIALERVNGIEPSS